MNNNTQFEDRNTIDNRLKNFSCLLKELHKDDSFQAFTNNPPSLAQFSPGSYPDITVNLMNLVTEEGQELVRLINNYNSNRSKEEKKFRKIRKGILHVIFFIESLKSFAEKLNKEVRDS